jgi:hypothetical protein
VGGGETVKLRRVRSCQPIRRPRGAGPGRLCPRLGSQRQRALLALLVDDDDAAVVGAQLLVGVEQLDALDCAVCARSMFTPSLTQIVSTGPEGSRRRM